MDVRNFRLRVVLRGSRHLKEDVEQILREYLRESSLPREKILEVLDVQLEEETPSLSNDLPMIRTQDLKAMKIEKKR